LARCQENFGKKSVNGAINNFFPIRQESPGRSSGPDFRLPYFQTGIGQRFNVAKNQIVFTKFCVETVFARHSQTP